MSYGPSFATHCKRAEHDYLLTSKKVNKAGKLVLVCRKCGDRIER